MSPNRCSRWCTSAPATGRNCTPTTPRCSKLFLAGDAERLLAAAEEHAPRLNAVIATLPTDTGLLVAPNISSAQ